MNTMRHVVMQVVKRSGGATHHVGFTINDSFVERLRQLRSLVPPLTALNKQRDLVIDKVRVRLPNAVWRAGAQLEQQIEGSCIVIANEGFFSCGGRDRVTKEKLVTYAFSIARLSELHAERPAGETFYIRDGVFTNDEPVDSPPAAGLLRYTNSKKCACRTSLPTSTRCRACRRCAPIPARTWAPAASGSTDGLGSHGCAPVDCAP